MNDNIRNTIYYSAVNLNEQFLEGDCTGHLSDDSVHFVLVYKTLQNKYDRNKREYYEQKLQQIGLVLSTENYDELNFVKIFAPNTVLCQYCDVMKLRMPIKLIPGLNVEETTRNQNKVREAATYVSKLMDDNLSSSFDKKYKWTAEFSINKEYLFDVKSKDFFFPSVKCLIINFILDRVTFSDKPQDIGIRKLLNENIYDAAYPIHDGNINTLGSQRRFFALEWANNAKIFHYQPLDDIKNYFGVKFALYFAWLGFYTVMLIPPSIVGILYMIYGWLSLHSDSLTNEICNNKLNIIMCPQCDKYCDYWNIIDACTYAKITHHFDNKLTMFFGLFMSIWSALYIELWKRYSAEITHKWGLTGFDLDAQHPRPEYLARFSKYKKKTNIVTKQEEPAVPFFIRLPVMVLSFSIALLWVLLALAAVFGIMIYRMAGIATDVILNDDSKTLNSMIISMTAGVINLAAITILNFLYEHLAMVLTKYEFHRTQVEFDDSLTLKIYMFQFVNFYSSLFYIAFLKGQFVGYPKKYNRIFGFRQEECSLGGCMMELYMQLAIIMIGKQALNNFIEFGIPCIKKSCKNSNIYFKDVKQWIEDYSLLSWDSKGMFYEYLEMVIQYGFVTLFVTAFPLAPLFAFINNIFETRLDAKKYLKFYRRPTVQRVKDIGMWFYIIEALGRISVVSNAFVIAFCSNYIPRVVYATQNSNKNEGFLNFSLSYFDVKDFENKSSPGKTKYKNISECRYSDYRNPHWYSEEEKYDLNMTYWHIFAARLAFIVVYQNVVSIIVSLVRWAIPDVPKNLKDQIKREALRTTEYIIEQETAKRKEF